MLIKQLVLHNFRVFKGRHIIDLAPKKRSNNDNPRPIVLFGGLNNPDLIKRAMQHGKLSKTSTAIQLTCNALKKELSLPLTPEEQELEAQMVVL